MYDSFISGLNLDYSLKVHRNSSEKSASLVTTKISSRTLTNCPNCGFVLTVSFLIDKVGQPTLQGKTGNPHTYYKG